MQESTASLIPSAFDALVASAVRLSTPEDGVVSFRLAELVVSFCWHVLDFDASSH